MPRHSRLVYSTELGRTCPRCRRPLHECSCARSDAVHGDGNIRISHSSKGRGGKTVTLITGLALTSSGLEELAGQLKKRCGTGGTVKEGTIEIQGDHRQAILDFLAAKGHRVKLAGG